jgi:p21-activated kinase 1
MNIPPRPVKTLSPESIPIASEPPKKPIKTAASNAEDSKGGVKTVLSSLLSATGIWSNENDHQFRPEISSPFNPIHLTHVGYNEATGEFTGLPREWEALLAESGISKQDQKDHPQAVIDIIGFYSESQKRADDAIFSKINNPYAVELQSRAEVVTPPKKPPRSISTLNQSSSIKPPMIPPRPSFTIKGIIDWA